MENSGERSASRRGRGRQDRTQPTDGGASATGALAFLLGVLIQLMQQPGGLTPQPPAGQLPNGNASPAALNAPQSTSPRRDRVPLLPRFAVELRDGVEGTSTRSDAPAGRARGAEDVVHGSSTRRQAPFDELASVFQGASSDVEQSTTTESRKSAHPTRKMTFPQSRSAPSRSSRKNIPSFLFNEVNRRGFSEPSQQAEESPHAPHLRASRLSRDASATDLIRSQSYAASRTPAHLRPRVVAEAHDEDDTSDESDAVEERRKRRVRGVPGAEFFPSNVLDSWQAQLLDVLSRLQSAGFGAEQSTSTTAATKAEGPAQSTHRMSFPKSISAPSRTSQSRKQFLGGGGHQLDLSEPSPPSSPLSDESLEDYLEAAYTKWKAHRRASLQAGDAKEGRSRTVRRRPRRPLEDGMSPPGRRQHHLRRSWPGRAPVESQSYLHGVSHMSRSSEFMTGLHSQPRGSLSGRDHRRFAAADDDGSDGSIESNGEDSRNDPSPLEVERRRVVAGSRSAPSPYGKAPVSADDWVRYERETESPQHMQRADSAAWNPYASPETSSARRRDPISRAPSHRHALELHERSTFAGTRDRFPSAPPQFWTEAFGVTSGATVDPTNDPYSTGHMSLQPSGLQPVSMTVQFYNHPSHVPANEPAARPPRPPPSGSTQGRPRQSGTGRSRSITEDRTPRTPTTKTTEMRRAPSQTPKTRSHSYSKATPQSPTKEERSDCRTEGADGQQGQRTAQPGASTATPPPDGTQERRQLGELSGLSLPVKEVGTQEGLPKLGSPSTVAATLPSSAAASLGATSALPSSLPRSRIPVSARRVSAGRSQTLTSASLSLPHTLTSRLSSSQVAAASPPPSARQVSSPGYSQLQTLEQQVSQRGAAPVREQPGMSQSPYYTAQPSQRFFLSLAPGSQQSSSSLRGESSEVRRAPAATEMLPSHLRSARAGRAMRTVSVPERLPVESSFHPLAEEVLQRSFSTGTTPTGGDTPPSDSPAGQPVEDEFVD